MGLLVFLQLLMGFWCLYRTANDKIDGIQNGVCSLCEAAATSLLLAAAFLAESHGGSDEDLDTLTLVLELTVISSNILLVAVFFPMVITVYNNFIVPMVGIAWKSDGDPREIVCQMLLTCLLLPYEIAGTMFGFSGGASASTMMGVVADTEGAAVEAAASSADLVRKYNDDEEEEEERVDGRDRDQEGGETGAHG